MCCSCLTRRNLRPLGLRFATLYADPALFAQGTRACERGGSESAGFAHGILNGFLPGAGIILPLDLSRIPAIPLDKCVVDLFLEDAERIFESAMAAAAVDPDHSEVAILLDSRRAIRIVDAAGWQLDSLQADYGATTVYRVARGASGVCLEGRSGQRSCRLRAESPAAAARRLLNTRFPQVTGPSHVGLREPSRNDRAETNAATVSSGQCGYWNQLERQRDLFGFLHGCARPGT